MKVSDKVRHSLPPIGRVSFDLLGNTSHHHRGVHITLFMNLQIRTRFDLLRPDVRRHVHTKHLFNKRPHPAMSKLDNLTYLRISDMGTGSRECSPTFVDKCPMGSRWTIGRFGSDIWTTVGRRNFPFPHPILTRLRKNHT